MSWLNIRRIIVFIVLFGLIAFVGIRVHLSYYLAVAVAFFISYSIIALEKLLYRRTLREVAIYLATIISGAILGSFIGFLIIQFPLFRRPETRGWIFLITNTATIYLFVAYILSRKDEIIKSKEKSKGEIRKYTKIVDTSALIDGRIVDMVELGFLEGNLAIPAFVLKELQNIADSKDPDKREKGRRGMEMLDKLKELLKDRLLIVREDMPGRHDVDEKLIELARKTGAKLITTDYNLKKVAEHQGVFVLNVNELTERLKLPLNSGDLIKIKIVREGKERDKKQGVGYLVDGTMVVVDGASSYIGQEIEVVVHSVLQTETGRIVFARLKGEM
uniref:TRAM domain-containing protein n=2 Tax=candidate division WOR-3 bacterium TaxID=2052148 RepID=A0A7V3ZY70_UNCW3